MRIKNVLLAVCCGLLCLLLTGCAAAPQEALTLSCAEVAEMIQTAAEFAELMDVNEKYLEKYLMIEADDLEDWAMRRDATRATPELILVLKVKPDADQADIKLAVQEYLDEEILLYRDYQPAQMFKLDSAKVLENGQYIVLAVSPDAAAVNTALGDGWK